MKGSYMYLRRKFFLRLMEMEPNFSAKYGQNKTLTTHFYLNAQRKHVIVAHCDFIVLFIFVRMRLGDRSFILRPQGKLIKYIFMYEVDFFSKYDLCWSFRYYFFLSIANGYFMLRHIRLFCCWQ